MSAMRESTKLRISTLGVLVLIIMVLLWRDPYTHGQIGGEYAIFDRNFDRLPIHRWQIVTSVFQMLLLTVAFLCFFFGSLRQAFFALCAESGIFVLSNVIYVLRDGLITRATIGDEGGTEPGAVTLV